MMGGQPVGRDPSCCAPSLPDEKAKAVRKDVYIPPRLFFRLERIAAEYGVSVQRVLIVAGQLCDERELRGYLDMVKE